MKTRVLLTAAAAAAWLAAGHLGLLAVLIYVWAAAMATATNTAKTRSVEERLNALMSTYGTFPGNVTIGGTLTVNGSSISAPSAAATIGGNLTVNGSSISAPNATSIDFDVATIDVRNGNLQLNMAQPPDYTAPNDGCSGGSWCTGERDFYNNLANGWNGLIGSMINRGLIA